MLLTQVLELQAVHFDSEYHILQVVFAWEVAGAVMAVGDWCSWQVVHKAVAV